MYIIGTRLNDFHVNAYLLHYFIGKRDYANHLIWTYTNYQIIEYYSESIDESFSISIHQYIL